MNLFKLLLLGMLAVLPNGEARLMSPAPTKKPMIAPTLFPTKKPTLFPTKKPTIAPTLFPTKKPTMRPIRILFIGNSLTKRNDMTGTLSKMLNSAGFPVSISVAAFGAATLQDHSSSYGTMNYIYSKAWDIVVLQEQSTRLSYSDLSYARRSVYPYAKILADSAKPAQIYLYETNAYISGYLFNDTYRLMQRRVNEGYRLLALELGAEVVHAGTAFGSYYNYVTDKSLLYSDYIHPSATGSFVIACAFYKEFSGKSLFESSYRPRGISQKLAKEIKSIIN